MWSAKFSDGTMLEEFDVIDGNRVEVSFKHVLSKLDNLESLSIIKGSRMFSVNMTTGQFTILQSGFSFKFHATDYTTVLANKIENIRPIYFVRERVDFAEGSSFVGQNLTETFTALGFQGNIGDSNIKRYIAILPDGTFTIEDK